MTRRFYPCLSSGCLAPSSHFALGGSGAKIAHLCADCFRTLPESEQRKFASPAELEFRSERVLHRGQTALIFASPEATFWGEAILDIDPRQFLVLEVRVGAFIQSDFPWEGCDPRQTISLLVERVGMSPGSFRAKIRGLGAPRTEPAN